MTRHDIWPLAPVSVDGHVSTERQRNRTVLGRGRLRPCEVPFPSIHFQTASVRRRGRSRKRHPMRLCRRDCRSRLEPSLLEDYFRPSGARRNCRGPPRSRHRPSWPAEKPRVPRRGCRCRRRRLCLKDCPSGHETARIHCPLFPSYRFEAHEILLTLAACGPFSPWTISNSTWSPSCRLL